MTVCTSSWLVSALARGRLSLKRSEGFSFLLYSQTSFLVNPKGI